MSPASPGLLSPCNCQGVLKTSWGYKAVLLSHATTFSEIARSVRLTQDIVQLCGALGPCHASLELEISQPLPRQCQEHFIRRLVAVPAVCGTCACGQEALIKIFPSLGDPHIAERILLTPKRTANSPPKPIKCAPRSSILLLRAEAQSVGACGQLRGRHTRLARTADRPERDGDNHGSRDGPPRSAQRALGHGHAAPEPAGCVGCPSYCLLLRAWCMAHVV